MGQWVTPDDLEPFAEIAADKATEMIEDAESWAVILAPCIRTLTDLAQVKAVRAIIRQAVLRWHESGSGAVTQRHQSAGPFAQQETLDTRQSRKGMFWPSEITDLQSICKPTGRAFMVDMAQRQPDNPLALRPDLRFQFDAGSIPGPAG